VRDAVLGERLAATGWFDPIYLKHLVEAHQSGARDYSAPLWTLLMFEAFLRQVVDAPSPLQATGCGDPLLAPS
jgi:asparagine synthase (glutamine-hydrolysing)